MGYRCVVGKYQDSETLNSEYNCLIRMIIERVIRLRVKNTTGILSGVDFELINYHVSQICNNLCALKCVECHNSV